MNILLDLFFTFAKIGTFSFGGGYAMIPLIEHECVKKKRWISSDELIDMTVIAESTPGPIAVNCATYTGYKKNGIIGAIFATLGMILPSFLIILLISFIFERLMNYEVVIKAFAGIRVAVAVLITQVALKMVRKMMKKTPNKALSIVFVMIFFIVVFVMKFLEIHISTIYLILISGFLGYILYRMPQKNGGMK